MLQASVDTQARQGTDTDLPVSIRHAAQGGRRAASGGVDQGN